MYTVVIWRLTGKWSPCLTLEKCYSSPSTEISRVNRWNGLFKNVLGGQTELSWPVTYDRSRTTVPAGLSNFLTYQPRRMSVGRVPARSRTDAIRMANGPVLGRITRVFRVPFTFVIKYLFLQFVFSFIRRFRSGFQVITLKTHSRLSRFSSIPIALTERNATSGCRRRIFKSFLEGWVNDF